MHILLTDILVCPRCGPGFGLILLADRLEDRHVAAGRLGCSNCRETYLIVDGVVEMGGASSAAGAGAVDAAGDAAGDVAADAAVRIAGLLGVSSGYVLLMGGAARHAEAVAALLPDATVTVWSAEPVVGEGGEAAGDGVSRVRAGTMPFEPGRMAGVALYGATEAEVMAGLADAARAVRPTGRLLLQPAPPEAETFVNAAGLRTLAREAGVLLAIR